jgi:hypothetical protein
MGTDVQDVSEDQRLIHHHVHLSDVVMGERSVPSFVEEQTSSMDELGAAEIRQATLPLLGLQPFSVPALPQWKISDDDYRRIFEALPAKKRIFESVINKHESRSD